MSLPTLANCAGDAVNGRACQSLVLIGLIAATLLLSACASDSGGDGNPVPNSGTTDSGTMAPGATDSGAIGPGNTNSGGNGQVTGLPVGDDAQCTPQALNRWVDDAMRDYYLYFDQVPLVDLDAYTSPAALVRDLRVPPDRFSRVEDAAATEALFEEGQTLEFGMYFRRDQDNRLRVALVQPGSPAAAAGIQRGYEFVGLNNTPLSSLSNAEFDAALGIGNQTPTTVFNLVDNAGLAQSISLTKTLFRFATVYNDPRLIASTDGSFRALYLPFLLFLASTPAEIDAVFRLATEEGGYTDLILDLRYNGGGYVSVADRLINQIAGSAFAGQVMYTYAYNENYSDLDITQLFETTPLAQNLSRLVVLTEQGTASASELVINSLKPYLDVATVGKVTNGKPFLSRGNDRCGHRLQAMEAINVNAVGESVANGITPTCEVFDDFDAALGDPAEAVLFAGLEYARTGSCPSAAPPPAANRVVQPLEWRFGPAIEGGARLE